MKIYKETEINHPLYTATLDSGITILVYDGYGEDHDGCVYKPVVEDRGEGECEVIGWRK